jgi:O-methyltransferase involved in polyketide biosynthesis
VQASLGSPKRRPAAGSLSLISVRTSWGGKALYGWENGYKQSVDTKIWQFGMQPENCRNFIVGYGWRLSADVGYDGLASRFIGPTGRKLTSRQVARMVYAQKT